MFKCELSKLPSVPLLSIAITNRAVHWYRRDMLMQRV